MTSISDSYHEAVLLPEVIAALSLKADGVYIDVTAGGGSHSLAILRKLSAAGRLIASDRDDEAVAETTAKLAASGSRAKWEVRHEPFAELVPGLVVDGIRADGILADLGVSSHQIDTADRGYSYRQDGPLDMRMDRRSTETAATIINRRSAAELSDLFRRYGEERFSGRIAAAIVKRREVQPFERTVDLAETIIQAMPSSARREAQHPARRVFQALRMEVNGELRELESLLAAIPALMNPGGRVLIITFHSLEDRIVKQTFKEWQDPCRCPRHLPCSCGLIPAGRIIDKGGVTASAAELKTNSRAKSARLRVFEMERSRTDGQI